MKGFQHIGAICAAALLIGCGGGESPSHTNAPSGDHGAGWRLTTQGDLNMVFDCLDKAGLALVSAHRGGPADGLPENALETLQATLARVPAMVEIDVAQSADGVLFLMHDDRLERTTTGQGFADAAHWDQLKTLRLKDGDGDITAFAPPKFSDVLAWSKSRTIVQVDFKRSARYENVIDEIYRQGAEDRVILIAYSMASARKLHSLAPDMMISLSINSQSELNKAVAAGVPENRLIAFTGTQATRPRLLTLLDRRNIEGIFGTLGGAGSIDAEIARSGDEARYAEIADEGVDIIATDRPFAAFRALADDGRAPASGDCGVSSGRAP